MSIKKTHPTPMARASVTTRARAPCPSLMSHDVHNTQVVSSRSLSIACSCLPLRLQQQHTHTCLLACDTDTDRVIEPSKSSALATRSAVACTKVIAREQQNSSNLHNFYTDTGLEQTQWHFKIGLFWEIWRLIKIILQAHFWPSSKF